MQEMHLSLFTGDRLLSFYFWGRCGRCDRQSLYNRSGIYRTSHVIIRPIICITFKYTCFHIAASRFYPFSCTKEWERPLFGAGAVFRHTAGKRTKSPLTICNRAVVSAIMKRIPTGLFNIVYVM